MRLQLHQNNVANDDEIDKSKIHGMVMKSRDGIGIPQHSMHPCAAPQNSLGNCSSQTKTPDGTDDTLTMIMASFF